MSEEVKGTRLYLGNRLGTLAGAATDIQTTLMGEEKYTNLDEDIKGLLVYAGEIQKYLKTHRNELK